MEPLHEPCDQNPRPADKQTPTNSNRPALACAAEEKEVDTASLGLNGSCYRIPVYYPGRMLSASLRGEANLDAASSWSKEKKETLEIRLTLVPFASLPVMRNRVSPEYGNLQQHDRRIRLIRRKKKEGNEASSIGYFRPFIEDQPLLPPPCPSLPQRT